MFPENHVAEILDREKELIRLNERINQGSPKLFNKNEKAAIAVKKFDKSVWKPEKVEIKTVSVVKPSPQASCNRARCESASSGTSKDSPKVDTVQNIIPRTLERKHINKDNLIKFLKAKAAILQNELESAMNENKEQNETIKDLTKKVERSEVAYNSLESNHNSLQQTIKKLEEKNNELRDVLHEKEDRLQSISKEQARISAEWAKLKKQNQTLEIRLGNLRQTYEATKARLSELSHAEKEFKFSKTQERTTLEGQIKDLKKERMQMLNAFKKQLLRIDQLKQQNNCFDEEKLIEIAEREYMKLLKWSSSENGGPKSH